MRRSVRSLVQVLAAPLPQPFKRRVFRRALGWVVADDAYVGLSYLDADHVVLEPGSYIGHFNLVRQVRSLHLGRGAYVKHFNHFFGCPEFSEFVDRSFAMGERSQIMSRHFFDVSGTVRIGSGCTIGGRETQMWSHSLVTRDGVDRLEPREMVLGDGVYVGARALLVHCRVPARAIVGAGAVLTRSYEADDGAQLVLAGNPAVVVRTRQDSG